MSGSIFWHDAAIPFRTGETVSNALLRAGVVAFGTAPTGQPRAVFCGIGLCQGCLVRANGRLTEACLLPAREGLRISAECGGSDV
jgi:predicted molibdopterin-dependent oxidoreductase YjgC